MIKTYNTDAAQMFHHHNGKPLIYSNLCTQAHNASLTTNFKVCASFGPYSKDPWGTVTKFDEIIMDNNAFYLNRHHVWAYRTTQMLLFCNLLHAKR